MVKQGIVELSENDPDVSKYHAINMIMQMHPHVRIAFVDSQFGKFSSVLMKWDEESKTTAECYRVELPGNPIIGEGKPENQNHALIFTRGRYMQTIDMNQDAYYEECLKMRTLLEEFDSPMDALRPGGVQSSRSRRTTIVGFNEHQFSAAFNKSAEFSALSEFTFTTTGQRSMDSWLNVRMHYGHPDVHDRLFLATRGGVAKANKTLCVNEDIFGSFNHVLRGGSVKYREYMTAGKGKDLGFNEVAAFEAKIGAGNAEQVRVCCADDDDGDGDGHWHWCSCRLMSMMSQVLSRDMARLNESMGIFRLLTFFHTSNGFFINNVLVVWATQWFAWSQLILTLAVPQSQSWALVVLEKDIIFLIQLGVIQVRSNPSTVCPFAPTSVHGGDMVTWLVVFSRPSRSLRR